MNDASAGDFVTLTWIVLRCGFGPTTLAALRGADPALTDPVAALLATFARKDCRSFAASQFGLPELPEAVDTVFRPRLSLDDVLRLAAFGRDHPRLADAVARAMAIWNLHVYSNEHPQVDWCLDGIQHYGYAKNSFCFVERLMRLRRGV